MTDEDRRPGQPACTSSGTVQVPTAALFPQQNPRSQHETEFPSGTRCYDYFPRASFARGRLLDEAIASGGDPSIWCELFDIAAQTSLRYTDGARETSTGITRSSAEPIRHGRHAQEWEVRRAYEV
jgi:hypothetical protein